MLYQEKQLVESLKQANIHSRLPILKKAILRNKMACCGDMELGDLARGVSASAVQNLSGDLSGDSLEIATEFTFKKDR